jgi:hypothetical protein
MCEKLTDHKTTVDVGMFNSCFHLEPAKSHVASATNAVIICIAVFSFYIIIENCVLDLSSFELNERNKMTLNKVPCNEHRAQGPCHCGPQNKIKVESVDGNHVILLKLEQSLMFH